MKVSKQMIKITVAMLNDFNSTFRLRAVGEIVDYWNSFLKPKEKPKKENK
jgi:hypothetical protein